LGRACARTTLASVSNTWISAGGKLMRCTAHPEVKPWPRVPKIGERAGCTACPPPGDPTLPALGDDLEAEANAVVPAPPGCRTQSEHEKVLTELGDFCMKQAKAIIDAKRKSNPSQSLAIKWVAEATKAFGRAAELGSPRERSKRTRYNQKLARQIIAGRKKLRGGGPN
jgi:hypothetical protein